MEVLKIATAGSVDDGKSTLIGRLLYETKSLTTDKLEAIEQKSKTKGLDFLDFSLATDGLVAEREQGITIDVAHIYFSTSTKNYIIADTPGHIEYTRNMVTGASTSQVAIILIDARKGVLEQTKRHFFINNLLKVKKVIVAINKMDLVENSQVIFEDIKKEFEKLIVKSDFKHADILFVPISALKGHNITQNTKKIKWYKGKSILELLDEIKINETKELSQYRFPVQQVFPVKNENDFAIYAGKLYGGTLKVGDSVTILPSLVKSKVKTISFFDKNYLEAEKNTSITIQLEDQLKIERGNMIVKSDELPHIDKNISAKISWLDSEKLSINKKYIFQHGVHQLEAEITAIDEIISTDFTKGIKEQTVLKLNEIAAVKIKLENEIFYDHYSENKVNGAFILIDKKSNNTSAVGFITK